MRSLFGGSTRASSEKNHRKPSQKSLGLRGLLPESEDATLRVLDLGPARSANLEFFSRYGGRLTVADFYNGLRAARAATADDDVDVDRRAKAFAELLPFDKSARFDLILAWDLLNYLTPMEQHLLMASLEPFCLSGTVILAFVSTQKKCLPRRPRIRFGTRTRSSTRSAKDALDRARATSRETCSSACKDSPSRTAINFATECSSTCSRIG